MIKTRYLALIFPLLLSACIQEGDLEKLQSKTIDGWSYLETIDKDGQQNSNASNQISEDETGIGVNLSFQCNTDLILGLFIETFSSTQGTAPPIKTRYAKSAFGRFFVSDIKAYNNQALLHWTGTQANSKPNTIVIELGPMGKKKEAELKLPTLKISIPTTPSPRDVTIRLDNPNIQKVFLDCQFKPAFMEPKKSNKEI
jgi:hypothetical protein